MFESRYFFLLIALLSVVPKQLCQKAAVYNDPKLTALEKFQNQLHDTIDSFFEVINPKVDSIEGEFLKRDPSPKEENMNSNLWKSDNSDPFKMESFIKSLKGLDPQFIKLLSKENLLADVGNQLHSNFKNTDQLEKLKNNLFSKSNSKQLFGGKKENGNSFFQPHKTNKIRNLDEDDKDNDSSTSNLTRLMNFLQH